MSEGLDMSLDEIIKNNKKSGGRSFSSTGGRGRGNNPGGRVSGSGSGPGPTRHSSDRGPTRPTPYFVPQAFHLQEMLIAGDSDTEAGTKLYISNLDYGVSNEDIMVLFSEIGVLKRYSIHYDRSGRSKGTAEVVFASQSDALAALKRYNNVQLDGKPMKLELVGVKIVAPVPVPPTTMGILGNPGNASGRQDRAVGRGQDRRGGGTRGFGRGRGRERNHVVKVSAKDLDADLEKYHLDAMQMI